ncbi:hypothetical protein FTX61_15790 [Nitriliruptoraceae bacterium ZYF776]|nr:hypothetical protein [Profundirhabdus halotolerans]
MTGRDDGEVEDHEVADETPDTAALESAFDGAAVLGLELDTRYRVLALTLEPTDGRAPWTAGRPDQRLQVLCSPVSTILASLRRRTDDHSQVLTFAEDQLVDVIGALEEPTVTGPLFGRPEPRPGSWAPEWSLEGRSNAPDGRSRTLTLQLRRERPDEALELDLFARFDEIQVRDPAGHDLVTVAS